MERDVTEGPAQGRVVLFGPTGFIGRHVQTAIEARGLTVVPVSHAQVDLADAKSVADSLRAGDIVVNAAGYPMATDTSPDGLRRLQRSNVDGVRNLADGCVAAGVEQFIHISSIAAMGRVSGQKINESGRGPIQSPYADSKHIGEEILAEYTGRLVVTVLRPTYVFGEGRTLLSVLCRAARLPIVPLPAGGKALIPFTYVGNVAHGVALTVGAPACHDRTFIIGDLRSYTLREIIVELANAMDRSPRLLDVPLWLAAAGATGSAGIFRLLRKTPVLDNTRLATMTTSVSYSVDAFVAATGYSPPIDLVEAAARMVRWYLSPDHERRGL